MKQEERTKEIYKVTWIGSVVNFLLLAFKFIAGIVAGSAAMVADAVHSLSDFITDVVVIVFVRLSNKPQDKDHDYGHGKYETLATAIIGIALLAVGAGICWNGLLSVKAVWEGQDLDAPGWLAFVAAVGSIIIKEMLYRYTVAVGRRTGSAAVIANAWHHRSDALSSIGTAVGIGGAIMMGPDWRVLDPIAAVAVSFFIMKVAVSLLRPCIGELTERSLPEDVENQITRMAGEIEGVSGVHNLRTRRIGNHYAIEMHVRMDGHLTLNEAHAKATAIEQRLRGEYGPQTHVGIHVEPVKNAEGNYDN